MSAPPPSDPGATPPDANAPLRPPVDEDSAPFFEGCRAGELHIQRCTGTGRLIFPPRPRSPWDPSAATEWVHVSGRGTIWSFAVPHPPLLPGFAEQAPYNVILVALEEDPRVRLAGNLVHHAGAPLGSVDPHGIEIGAPVRVVFERIDEELTLPRWVLDR